MAQSVYSSIEEIVRDNVTFDIPAAGAKSWNRIYCAVCGDGKRTKGPRGGWAFEGEMCFYHCFNCGIDGNFDPNREIPWSKEMGKIFTAFNIPKNEVAKLVFAKKIANGGKKPDNKPIHQQISINPIPVPDHFYELATADIDNVVANKAREYLKSRFVNPDSQKFYLSTCVTNSDDPAEIALAKSLRDRVIIPSFYNNKLVYWIARSLDPKSKLPYINAPVPKHSVIYGFDKLYKNPKDYLFVSEGYFDSYQLNGVAVLSNGMTQAQIEILEKSPRKKVVVPDFHGDSDKLVEQAMKHDWGISPVSFGDCKDISAACVKHGKLYVLDHIMKNVITNPKIAKTVAAQRRAKMERQKKIGNL